MIVVALQGGIGNQMFQYAAGKSLAFHLNDNVVYDISAYKYDKYRQFDLSGFNLNLNFLSSLNRYKIFFLKKMGLSSWSIYIEQNAEFNHDFYQFKKNTYLNGYFQSENYFSNIESIIRKDFDFILQPHPLQKEILQTNSVSIHFRRGDYCTNTNTFETHGICSIEYYLNAIKYIKTKINNPSFFIFSDDITWVKSNLKISEPVYYVSGNNLSSYTEMGLMSICQNNIIANSSFSWWAAWLNKNSEKTIIAPEFWFKDLHFQNNDIVPKRWIKIDNR